MKQETALSLMQQGRNIFLTGQAGSGKTHVINQYVHWLRTHGIEPAITASTGIAATHIGGTTVHSWSGMGIKNRLTPQDLEELLEKEHLWKRLNHAQVLILDEISMIAPDFLDGIDTLLRAFRQRPDDAFGGMQVIVSGDFFQLPPIVRRNDTSSRQPTTVKRYAWQSQAWLDADMTVCYLSEQYRQDSSDALLRILQDIRDGEATEDSLSDLRERFTAVPDDGIVPIKLYTHNIDVDAINQKHLDDLETLPHFFEAETRGSKKNIDILEKGCLALMSVELKVGAQVMFVKNNYDKGYANGSMGTIMEFDEHNGYPVVELYTGGTVVAAPDTWALEQDGKSVAELSQVPLRLAWAITIHKSQGMSLDTAEIDLSNCFEMGQGYVALSRVRSLDGLYLKGFNSMATMMDPLTIRVDVRFQELSAEHELKNDSYNSEQVDEYITNFIEYAGGSLDVVEYTSKLDKELESTYEKTRKLLEQKMTIEEIAEEREYTTSTIIGHISALLRQGVALDLSAIECDSDIIDIVREVYEELYDGKPEDLYTTEGQVKLKPIFNMLDGSVPYDDIKRALLFIV